MEWDLVVYEKKTKVIVIIVQNLKDDPKYLICGDYVSVYLPHNEYRIIDEGDYAYFESLQDKVIYLDEYRGRYQE